MMILLLMAYLCDLGSGTHLSLKENLSAAQVALLRLRTSSTQAQIDYIAKAASKART